MRSVDGQPVEPRTGWVLKFGPAPRDHAAGSMSYAQSSLSIEHWTLVIPPGIFS
jgi:hypothetical protein